MILAMTGEMLMQFVDGIFMSWHSVDAVAALGPASVASWTVRSPFIGMVGYVSTFVAQYLGAGRPDRVGHAVWQAVYLALGAGALLAALSGTGGVLASWAGHAGAIAALEAEYYRILCWGAPAGLLHVALSGFLSGLGRTRALMAAELVGQGVHGGLAYVLIFGKAGFPRLGIGGAAWATVAGQLAVAMVLAIVFLAPAARRDFSSWAGRKIDTALCRRLVEFGLPSGARFFFDMTAWTLFLVVVGRVGPVELAASSITFRINGVSFFPVIGISTAVSVLVGQAQGAGRPDVAERVVWRGLVITQIWMVGTSLVFVLLPRELLALFHAPGAISTAREGAIAATGVVLLRFVALYGLLDGCNMILMSALQGAGDTRFSLRAMAVANLAFASALLGLDRLAAGVYALWTAATVYVMSVAVMWLFRFRGGRWRAMRVVETPAPGMPYAENSA